MCVQWQGMPTIQTRRADKTTRNAGNNVANCQKQTTTVCDV